MQVAITRKPTASYLEILPSPSSDAVLICIHTQGHYAMSSGTGETLHTRQALASSITRWMEATDWRAKSPVTRLSVIIRKAGSILELIGLLEISSAEARNLRRKIHEKAVMDRLVAGVSRRAKVPKAFHLWSEDMQITWLHQHQAKPKEKKS